MVAAGHWLVLPATEEVLRLKGLRLSPIGVVPQRERRPRTIVDYSYSGVNQDTVRLAPPSMQFGRAFERFVTTLHQADERRGPTFMMKLDLADAFMRVGLQLSTIPTLGALLPRHPKEPPLIAFPLVLPMGWIDSPPFFCAVSETIADRTNDLIREQSLPDRPHRLQEAAATQPARARLGPADAAQDHSTSVPRRRKSGPLSEAVTYCDVYMDDELGAVQGSPERRKRVQQAFMHAVDEVLRPLEPGDNPNRKEPTSVKKLKKGDGCWSQRKTILGWLLNTRDRTVHLAPHRREKLESLLAGLPASQRTISLRRWRQVVGELRSLNIGLPGARGLYSHLQELLPSDSSAPPNTRLRLTPLVHAALDDFRWLLSTQRARPTRWAELLPTSPPAFIGSVDAAKAGMGGVWFGTCGPCLWRQPFSERIQQQVVSFDNPMGNITNSDLELTGLVAHFDVVAQQTEVRERTLHAVGDNVASLAWQRKGSSTSLGPRSFLLRLHAAHQRLHRYVPRSSHIPGVHNQMADLLSRRWDLSDAQLLTLFDTSFPQDTPWKLCHLNSGMRSAVTSALSKQPSPLGPLINAIAPATPPLTSGLPSSPLLISPRTSSRQARPYLGSSSSPCAGVLAPCLPADGPSSLDQWRTPYASWRRPTRWWASPTSGSTPRVTSTSGCNSS